MGGIRQNGSSVHKTFFHTLKDNPLKQAAEQAGSIETSAPVLRYGGMIGDTVIHIQSQEPAIGHVYLYFLLNPAF